ncbi:MAG: hypothetical protein D6741_00010, partial [Planctomycetota bacterium]
MNILDDRVSMSLSLRTFRNTDPPHLTRIWRESTRDLADVDCGTSPVMLERLVFGHLFFDPAGLIIAERDRTPVGFAHAGFPPDESGNELAGDVGVVCMIRILPDEPIGETAIALLEACEKYLADRGAKEIKGGTVTPHHPFYAGLYGGCLMPGIAEDDRVAREAFETAGYTVERTVDVYRCELASYTRPVDPRLVGLRATVELKQEIDPAPKTRFEAACEAQFRRVRFRLYDTATKKPVAGLMLHEIECDHCRALRTGILDMRVVTAKRNRGYGTLLLADVLTQLRERFEREGRPSSVEAVVDRTNEYVGRMLMRSGFDKR